MFHKLINKHKGRLAGCISELNVDGEVFKTEESILEGWHKHFSNLATANTYEHSDVEYAELIRRDISEIIEVCNESLEDGSKVTKSDVYEIICDLNRGKSPDVYGLTAEHFLYGGDNLLSIVYNILQAMIRLGKVPDCLKTGLISPVFKNKGSNKESKNYRGITVTPVLSKILELLLRKTIRPAIDKVQSDLQRGFTEGSSCMNCALILEEYLRECKDMNKTAYVAFLDAKSAFDVVSHDSLLRKLYNIGVEGKSWSVIHSLYQEAVSAVKWNSLLSRKFRVEQGVRQGGILSTDCYKLYKNNALLRVEKSGFGASIGTVFCGAPTCADDVLLMTDDPDELQLMLDIAFDYSGMENYLLQPVKSVIVVAEPSKRAATKATADRGDREWNLGGVPMPQVESTTHMGMPRGTVKFATEEVTVNIQKARRSMYSLMPAGLHGENGLDPQTVVHIFQVYVIPVLLYGLEVAVPSRANLDTLERFLRTSLKQI